jgi:hypothetical protein
MEIDYFDTPGEERIARMSESDDEENSDDSKVEVSSDGTSS